MNDFNVIIIGGGSAGFAAAIRAAESGARTALIESGRLGGECPNSACVPTNILLHAARLLDDIRHAQEYGVGPKRASFDFKRVIARKDAIVDQLGGERLNRILDQRGISLFAGRATFLSSHAVDLDGKTISADKFVVATGSAPYIPPIEGLEEAGYITNKEALNLTELPRSIAVIGAGAIGVEFAQIFDRFGVKTTLIDSGPTLLGHEDAEISELLKGSIQGQGVKVITGVEVGAVKASAKRKVVQMVESTGLKEVAVSEVMVAAGRSPSVDGLNLGAAGVKYDEYGIDVDDFMKTSADNIWACGDVTGKLFYTHMATYQGDVAGFNATAKKPDIVDYRAIPHVVFTDPEVAGVGLTETAAFDAGFDVRIGRMPYRYLGKALIAGERHGLVKLIVDGSSRLILGGQIIGDQAGELIHEITLAMKAGMSVDELAEVVHAYPTLAEGIEAAAADAAQDTGIANGEQAA